ncbi:hypothetical protein M446_4800 [Methylobacterium sp. 4-46]|uniref:hypothetical protein n=1 Tax=unclassified Methylobacterium TaxID=2615210 RepID=UPI000152CB37|nr:MULTISPECIES: hypothetical protein [Methylobacterium]ACA19130.1 hypothetical protein M446_4800 [Methylobacterium sp. 4-46]WFT78341.1 hypothetical protein QA634_24125 [Methylobacterium nodulans]
MARHDQHGADRAAAALPDRMARLTRRPGAPEIHYESAAPPSRGSRKEPGERPASYIPWPIRLVLKLLVTAAVMLGVTYGPGYLNCRRLREEGGFFYGMTMPACTRQATLDRISTMQHQFEDVARAIGAH